ncbi:hypothetical protein BAG01nite_48180 [Brevibacillus agri]|uniref:Flavodoxin-like fold domain-containing protein n=1 Tax=Brevibacillus agri TaxID=51101 RepID=A0ABQ0SY95_9BACL|nr:hypothetical protein BAG01nite_48180 [Brevibacillus agri]
MTYGWAYGSEGNKLHNKEFLLAISVGGPEQAYERDGYNYFTIAELTTPHVKAANRVLNLLTTISRSPS